MIELTQLEILQYSMLIVYLVFLIITSLMFFNKYIEFKIREYFFVGLAFLLVAVCTYTPYVISFIMILLTGNGLNNIVYIIAMSLLPAFLIAWMIAFTNLMFENKQKLILSLTLIVIIILEIIYYLLLFFIGPSAIGTEERGIYMYWTPFASIFILIINLIFLLTALLFAIKALRSNNKEIRLKGKLLTFATVLIILGSLFDGLLTLPGMLFIITRIIQITATILYYLGFTLPNSIRRFFLKEKD